MPRDNSEIPPRISGAEIIPSEGERVFIGGPTGSGKSLMGIWLARRIPQSPMIIYDTKREPEFSKLPRSRVVTRWENIDEALDDGETDYVIFRPSRYIATNPKELDNYLMDHLERFSRIAALLDETYAFHNSGRAGPGLQSLLTQGRSEGITTIMMAQRPAWISLFCLSESQRFYLFDLAHEDDRKRISKVIPGFDELPRPPEFHFYYMTLRMIRAGQAPVMMPPVALDPMPRKGDNRQASKADEAVPRHNWIR